jgi:hypothetical protein
MPTLNCTFHLLLPPAIRPLRRSKLRPVSYVPKLAHQLHQPKVREPTCRQGEPPPFSAKMQANHVRLAPRSRPSHLGALFVPPCVSPTHLFTCAHLRRPLASPPGKQQNFPSPHRRRQRQSLPLRRRDATAATWPQTSEGGGWRHGRRRRRRAFASFRSRLVIDDRFPRRAVAAAAAARILLSSLSM